MTQNIVVIGDVHHHIWLAVEGLNRLEAELRKSIDQVFSVGDLGLFLNTDDWACLTGPSKHRKPEDTERIRKAWKEWHWPLSMIGGNHEPYNRLRDWDKHFFSSKLEYTNAGELSHTIPGLKVAGLSGIYHPEETEFVNKAERHNRKLPRAESWEEMVKLAVAGKISRARLSYYKEFEIELLKNLKPAPHLLLLHDWPSIPPNVEERFPRRPETEIVEALQPHHVACGHHHSAKTSQTENTQVHALNIIAKKLEGHYINPGWATIFEWSPEKNALTNPQRWPK